MGFSLAIERVFPCSLHREKIVFVAVLYGHRKKKTLLLLVWMFMLNLMEINRCFTNTRSCDQYKTSFSMNTLMFSFIIKKKNLF